MAGTQSPPQQRNKRTLGNKSTVWESPKEIHTGISYDQNVYKNMQASCFLLLSFLAVLTAGIQNSFIDVAAKLKFTLQESPYDQTGQKTWLHNVQVEDD